MPGAVVNFLQPLPLTESRQTERKAGTITPETNTIHNSFSHSKGAKPSLYRIKSYRWFTTTFWAKISLTVNLIIRCELSLHGEIRFCISVMLAVSTWWRHRHYLICNSQICHCWRSFCNFGVTIENGAGHFCFPLCCALVGWYQHQIHRVAHCQVILFASFVCKITKS